MKTLASSNDRAELIRRLGGVRPDSVPHWGCMSAHQMMCHLADAFRMAIGERQVTPAHNVLTRTLVKHLVLAIPLPWPSGIRTSPELDANGGGTRPVDFASDRAQVAALIDGQVVTPWLGDQAHPIFGPMTRAQWLRWGWLHTDHHLRQFGA